jgi:hypothetical protein
MIREGGAALVVIPIVNGIPTVILGLIAYGAFRWALSLWRKG